MSKLELVARGPEIDRDAANSYFVQRCRDIIAPDRAIHVLSVWRCSRGGGTVSENEVADAVC